MWARGSAAVWVTACAAAWAAGAVTAPEAAPDGEELVSAYLDRPALRGLLAEHLTQRIKAAPAGERADLAERLGRVYIELMTKAPTAAERQRWEKAASDLAKLAPDAQSLELRIDLLRSAYTLAEDRAERRRLRLSPRAGEDDDVAATLRDLRSKFAALGGEAQRRVDNLQRSEQAGRSTERQADLLAEARRLRSTAAYYAGWTAVYLGLLERDAASGEEALRQFAVIVNGPSQAGRPAMLDRLSKGFLRYEHVARAALGCALALSARGSDVDALRWMDELENTAELDPAVRGQLVPRRLTVLANARRWPEVERLMRGRRGDPAKPTPLDPLLARQLAVAVGEGEGGAHAAVVSQLGQWAVQDLIARGALDQVAELVTVFPNLPLGDSGFVPKYIRGMRAYEVARRAHAAAGRSFEEPASDPGLVNQWRESASLLSAAVDDAEARARPRERAAAMLAAGRSLLLAGEAMLAGERFVMGHEAAPDAAQREELLWAAAVAFDRAVRGGRTDAQARLDEVTTLYLREHPQSPRAADLLVRRGSAPGLDDQQALAILLGVPRDASAYEAARRQAVRLLYRQYRAAGESERGFLAGRFAPIAEESLAADRRATLATESTAEQARAAAERAILTARQMLDVILTAPEPDVRRAEAVLGVIDLLAGHAGVKLDDTRAELAFRRLQIAQARGDEPAAVAIVSELRGMGDDGARFVEAAERSSFQLAVRRWQRVASAGGEEAASAAREVVVSGKALIAQLARSADPRALRNASVVSVHKAVAEAATQLGQRGETAMCQLALDLDRAVLEVRAADAEALLRVALNSECVGAPLKAIETWTRLMEAAAPGSAAWFRARTESLRLLVANDAAAAAAAFAQLRVLYPDFGPEPYRERLRSLERQLPQGAGGAP